MRLLNTEMFKTWIPAIVLSLNIGFLLSCTSQQSASPQNANTRVERTEEMTVTEAAGVSDIGDETESGATEISLAW